MRTLLILWALIASLSFAGPSFAAEAKPQGTVTYRPDVTFTLRTSIADGRLVYIGDAGAIKGEVNPDLQVPENAVVQINVINGDGAIHDIAVPEFDAKSDEFTGKGSSTAIVFRTNKNGTFEYLCTLPGHKAAGMFGSLIVGEPQEKVESDALDIVQDPTAVGKPVGNRGPEHVTVDLETTEVVGQLDNGTTYKYWTFNNKVPGPFIRVREGDTVTINMANAENSDHIHSIDLHAVTEIGR